MKRLLLAVALVAACSAVARAEDAAPTGPRFNIFTKLFRGAGNVLASPVEIPVSLFNVAADTDVTVGLTFGTLSGVIAGAERAVAGVIDMGTFIFPPYDRPLIVHDIGKSAVTKAATEAFPAEF
jgi:putative exosortase-associated protein (TIGR04073 family)